MLVICEKQLNFLLFVAESRGCHTDFRLSLPLTNTVKQDCVVVFFFFLEEWDSQDRGGPLPLDLSSEQAGMERKHETTAMPCRPAYHLDPWIKNI
jgi:hypothetical protein